MTAKEIVDHCKHVLHGACGSCIDTALATLAYDAVLRYAQGESHICANQKVKPYGELLCSAGCNTVPRHWLRDVLILHGGRVEGWRAARARAAQCVPQELRAVILELEPTEE